MRGINIAMLVFALGVFAAFIAGSGFAAIADVDPGPQLVDQREQVEQDAGGERDVSNVGENEFFGINVDSGGVIGTLFALYNAVTPMARAANIPSELAKGIGSMAIVFGGGFLLLQWLRGFRAED